MMIEEPGEDTCPVKLFKSYYLRMGYFFGNHHSAYDDNYLFPVVRLVHQQGYSYQVSDGSTAVAQRTVLDDARQILRGIGYNEPFTGKSSKMSGVRDAYKAGAQDIHVRDQGRWASVHTPQHYKTVTTDYMRKIASFPSLARSERQEARPEYFELEHNTQEESFTRDRENTISLQSIQEDISEEHSYAGSQVLHDN